MKSTRALAFTEVLRSTLDAIDKLPDPAEREEYTALVSDLRSRRPVNVAPISFGPPTDPGAIRDPRGA
ncbi:MAG: hypothetical protein NT062_12395 [Proteobacteria bacterium]|nr:hypothetical protein [Pseudomonadota bacterium]